MIPSLSAALPVPPLLPVAESSDKLVSQQIGLLENRIERAKSELTALQKQQLKLSERYQGNISKKTLDQSTLDVAVAKSNLDSINIELTESRQTVTQLEKEVQELRNQINVVNVFGARIHSDTVAIRYRNALKERSDFLVLEKIRMARLLELQGYAISAVQWYETRHIHLQNQLHSQEIFRFKNQQTQTERDFQAQQTAWFERIAALEKQLDVVQHGGPVYDHLRASIFYANESVSLIYLQMLIARYQESIHQLEMALILPDTISQSISQLNHTAAQLLTLSRQLDMVAKLLNDRTILLLKPQGEEELASAKQFTVLNGKYTKAKKQVEGLVKQVASLRVIMDRALQREISARQGPDFSIRAWIDLGGEIVLLPSLTFQVVRSLGQAVMSAVSQTVLWRWLLLCILECAFVTGMILLHDFLRRLVATMADHESGHINLKWLMARLLQRMLPEMAIFSNIVLLFVLGGIPFQSYAVLAWLVFVWLVFRVIALVAKISLTETVHDRAGHDVRLYRHLRTFLVAGGIVTAFAAFMNQLPVVYEVKELSFRLFLFFLFVISLYLLRQWQFVPNLILMHIDEKRTYVRRVIRILGLLIPLVLLVNSLAGLLGYINFVLTVSWYESIFIVVLAGYLVLRGLLIDGMAFASRLLIRHVTNGWLWTEAFLKPADRILQLALFLSAWAVLFLLYGWNSQSTMVRRLDSLLHWQMVDVLNTVITPFSLIKLVVVVYFLSWIARWTREFVYRMLLFRTQDLGVRNSLAILSQYAMVVAGIFVCLSLLGIDFRALAVVATAFVVSVGLGLRDLANNFVCGFLLLLERPLRIGDTISVGEYEGEVIHIGGRAVTLRTWDHIDVLIPNAEIFSRSFCNWTAMDNIVRTVISIKINRHDDPHRVQKLIVDTLDAHPGVMKEPSPEVFLKELAEGMAEFEIRYFLDLRKVRSRPELRSEVLMAIRDTFEREGIKPPYPHRELLFREEQTDRQNLTADRAGEKQ